MKRLGINDIDQLEFDPVDRSPIFFDIETGPCDQVNFAKALIPEFKAPSNYTAPEKIEAYIAKKEDEFWDKAALDAVTGEICAFGFRYQGQNYYIDEEGPTVEQVVLHGITNLASKAGQRTWIGHNIHDFDLPFIVRRLWKYGMTVPVGWYSGKWWSEWLVDTGKMWGLAKFKDMIGLNRLALYLGHVSGKDGKSGKDFHKLVLKDPDAAYEYLANDLELTEYVYNRMK